MKTANIVSLNTTKAKPKFNKLLRERHAPLIAQSARISGSVVSEEWHLIQAVVSSFISRLQGIAKDLNIPTPETEAESDESILYQAQDLFMRTGSTFLALTTESTEVPQQLNQLLNVAIALKGKVERMIESGFY